MGVGRDLGPGISGPLGRAASSSRSLLRKEVQGLLRGPEGNNFHSTKPLLGATRVPGVTYITSFNPHGNSLKHLVFVSFTDAESEAQSTEGTVQGHSAGDQGPNHECLSPWPIQWSPKVLPGNILSPLGPSFS